MPDSPSLPVSSGKNIGKYVMVGFLGASVVTIVSLVIYAATKKE